MEPSRLLILTNGAVVGVFPEDGRQAGGGVGHDGTKQHGASSAVVMEPCGACFTHVRQDGTTSRQLSDFCRRELVPHLTTVCSFRNAHSPRPYLSRRIHGKTATQQEDSVSSSSSGSRRRRRRVSPRPIAHWPAVGGAQTSTATTTALCTNRTDGTVEVRAAGGNARLTLSASGTVAEARYAVAIPGPTPHANASSGGSTTGTMAPAGPREWREAATSGAIPADLTDGGGGGGTGGNEWVTRKFLVCASLTSGVPPGFAHALEVARRASASAAAFGGRGEAQGAVGAAVGRSVDGVGGGGLVASELPRPEDSPDHASWETVWASPPFYSDARPHRPHSSIQRDRGWHTAAAPPVAAAPSADPGGLLAVDVMKLAQGGAGFAGGLAAVVESVGGCTYRVVAGGDECGSGDEGVARGRKRGDKVNIHVVVEADGTEIYLEDDFVHLVRPPFSDPKRQPGAREQHLLHVSAASTIRFRVPLPCSPGAAAEPRNGSAATASPTASCEAGLSREEETGAAASGWTEMSLGDIASRALALRHQFLRCSVPTAGERRVRRGGGVQQPTQGPTINPPTFVMPGIGGPGFPSVDTQRSAVPAPHPPRAAPVPRQPRGRYSGDAVKTPRAAAATASEAAAPVVVVESVERGGASFVAFTDGRARGAFADRTIVTLGTPFYYRPFREDVGRGRYSSGGGKGIGGGGTRASPLACSGEDLEAEAEAEEEEGEEEEEDRDIEVIRPDGTVIRLTARSLRRQGGGLGPLGGTDARSNPSHTHPRTTIPRDPRTGSSGGRISTAAATIHARHRASATTPMSVGGGGGSDGSLRPYVVAVLRFAAWAVASPAERRAAAERGTAGRTVAVAEAARNRRFVGLCRAATTPTRAVSPHFSHPLSDSPTTSAREEEASSPGMTSQGRERGERCDCPGGAAVGEKYGCWKGGSSAVGATSVFRRREVRKEEHAVNTQENARSEGGIGFVGGREQKARGGPPGGSAARQRNAVVARLLEANREVLMGGEASGRFATRDVVFWG